jgi:enoyl-CoA hydratase/carnithine racemase
VALAAACDRVVASSEAVFSATFTRVGLAGDLGIHWSLPRRVGPARARQMLMLPERVRGPQALDWGLVDRVVEPGGVLEAAIADAARLADGPPLALAAIKSLSHAASPDPFTVLDQEAEHQIELWGSADFAEGGSAFRERRAPSFGGR